MAVKKLQAIRAASKPVFKPDAANLVWLVIVGIGLLPFTLLALLALVVILVLLVMFAGGSQLTHSPDPSVSGSSAPGEIITELAGGDGRGTFAGANVPDQKLVEPIVDAAQECDLLTPVIIAAQIEWASGFDPKWEGPDGGKGLSQLPPEVFSEFGEDDDENGEVSAFDPEDSIYAHARYFCHLAGEVKRLIDDNKVIGGHLTLTLMAWDMGLEAVEAAGGMPIIYLDSYPFLVRGLFAKYTADAGASSTTAPSTSPIAVPSPARVEAGRRTTAPPAPGGTSRLSAAQFEELFPSRNSFYTYAGLTEEMKKFPAFAGTGDETTRKRELAAFLATVDHESGGLVHIEEINRSAWGDYCDTSQPYGCAAGQTYHGRGPIQLSWNTNYKAAGDALGIDLLNEPDLVKTDSSVAWRTALWFWMTQTGAGTMTAHAATTGDAGFGETIRTVNGAVECGGRASERVQNRIARYKRVAAVLGVQPEEEGKLTC